ncbi:MAG: hypothetical protein KatS3mg071_0117 [Meiothermus sp.]|nr:MAG: hypothetical protein KatS3mg071_0117 [Meiothermus sp.]
MSEVKITPLARRLAEENGIDWRQIKGTGPDGTVVERDILAFLAKVMAGEVNLPPTPEEAAPPASVVPDMTQAQAVLQKEGVQLGDLVPSSPSTPPPPESALPTLEDIEFDIDLEPTPPPPVPPASAAFEEAPTLAPEPEIVPNFEEPKPLVNTGPLPTLQWEEPEPLSPTPEVNPELASLPPLPSEPDLEPPSSANKLVWETQEVLTAPEVPAPAFEPLAPGMSFTNNPEPRPAEAELPPVPGYQPPVEAPPTPPAAAIPTPFASAGLGAAPGIGTTPSTQMLRVQAWQRLVSIAPAQEAAQTLSEAWHMEVGLDALLYRAVDKALSDTQTPLRPTKGHLEGNELKSLRVAPAQSLRGTLDSLRMASEPAEGLVVLSLADSAFDQVIFPGLSTLTLGRASGGHALLSLSGDMQADQAGKLLERIAYYLERPILLA